MELNLQKIKLEMERSGIETKAALARKMKIDKQLIQYYFKTKTIKAAEKFGKFFKINSMEFIK
uniref:Uncharacterized protein n=1 Tax=viral metagenome TaxID=1070528 RepID=A0A6M3XSL3_9ZZZZ